MPNVLWITVDDITYTMLERRANALNVKRVAQTPVLNAFQDGGINYTRFYGQSVCSPTRATAMLGKFGFRHGMGNNADISSAGAPAIGESWLCTGLPSVSKGTFGKWHLYTSEHTTNSAGVAGRFDTYVGLALSNIVGSDTYWYWDRFENGSYLNTLGAAAKQGALDGQTNRNAANYATTVTAEDATTWIDAQVGDWFCWVQFSACHIPIHVPPSVAERTAAGKTPTQYMSAEHEAIMDQFRIYLGVDPGNPELAENVLDALGWDAAEEALLASYIAMMETVDAEIGNILSHVDTSAATGDTTVFIFSDNGEKEDFVQSPMDPLKTKFTTGEVGIRLPLIVQGPGVDPALHGKDCRGLVHMADLWATTLGLFGVDPDVAFSGIAHDSIDFSPTFTDLEGSTRTFALCENFKTAEALVGLAANPKGGIKDSATGETNDPDATPIAEWIRAIVDDNWKLITKMPTGPASVIGDITYELYNMRSDYIEAHNFIREPSRFPEGIADVGGSEAAWKAVLRLKATENSILPYPTTPPIGPQGEDPDSPFYQRPLTAPLSP